MLAVQSLYVLASQTVIVAITVLILFLPALVELRKPKDSGPRLIKDNSYKIRICSFKIDIVNIEEEPEGQSIKYVDNFLYRFPNLEV